MYSPITADGRDQWATTEMVKAGPCADLHLIGPNRSFGHGQPAGAAPDRAPETARLARLDDRGDQLH
jgi:hypothetical protein